MTGVPDGEEKEKEAQNLFKEIITENFLKLGEETHIQVQESQKSPNKMNPRKSTSRYIIIKMAKIKDKERILKAAKENKIPTREAP